MPVRNPDRKRATTQRSRTWYYLLSDIPKHEIKQKYFTCIGILFNRFDSNVTSSRRYWVHRRRQLLIDGFSKIKSKKKHAFQTVTWSFLLLPERETGNTLYLIVYPSYTKTQNMLLPYQGASDATFSTSMTIIKATWSSKFKSYWHLATWQNPTQALSICVHTRKHLLHPEQVQRNNEVVLLHYPVELQITAEKIYCSI